MALSSGVCSSWDRKPDREEIDLLIFLLFSALIACGAYSRSPLETGYKLNDSSIIILKDINGKQIPLGEETMPKHTRSSDRSSMDLRGGAGAPGAQYRDDRVENGAG